MNNRFTIALHIDFLISFLSSPTQYLFFFSSLSFRTTTLTHSRTQKDTNYMDHRLSTVMELVTGMIMAILHVYVSFNA
jgi:hypothetical protein